MSDNTSSDPHSWEHKMREPLSFFTLCISENNPQKYYDRYKFEKSKISLQGAPASGIDGSLMAFMETSQLKLVSNLKAVTTGLYDEINCLKKKPMTASEMHKKFGEMQEDTKKKSDKHINDCFEEAQKHLYEEEKRLDKEKKPLEKDPKHLEEDPESDLWTEIVRVWEEGIGMVLAAWAKTWDWICQAAKDVADFFVGVWESVKNAMIKAVEWIEEAAQNVKDFFKSLF
ncbi:hypothetical protein Q9L58_009744 [Maublancomyces gigas]|uniref:Uncharacterized protein n=1 Tax=Discina gigas TaxID=1032678 RepID=A0ABR3G620_9PEZI